MATILITGAGRGIGREMARQAAARGDRVIGTVRGAAEPIPGVTFETLEVTDPAAHAALAARLSGVPIDLLVCNAGILRGRGGLADAWPAGDWSDSILANVAGPFWTVQALLPNLRAATSARVAVISSRMGSNAHARGNSYIYRATKAAATNLVSNLAVELGPEGIACGAWHPGWVRTGMGGDAADISAEESAAGLLARFDALSMATSGCYECWDGTPLDH